MFTNFQPSSHRRYVVSTRKLRRLCRRACSLEEMALFWCGAGKRILISRSKEGHSDVVTFSFFFKKRLIGTMLATASDVLNRYLEYVPLDETILCYSDKEGARPNDPWFESRSSRLGVTYSLFYEMNRAPGSAFAELILSYVLSSVGFAEIQSVAVPGGGDEAVRIGLIYLGGKEITGWTEEFVVMKKELFEVIAMRNHNREGLIH